MGIKGFTSNLLRVTKGQDQAEEAKRTGKGPLRQKAQLYPNVMMFCHHTYLCFDSGDDIYCGLYATQRVLRTQSASADCRYGCVQMLSKYETTEVILSFREVTERIHGLTDGLVVISALLLLLFCPCTKTYMFFLTLIG